MTERDRWCDHVRRSESALGEDPTHAVLFDAYASNRARQLRGHFGANDAAGGKPHALLLADMRECEGCGEVIHRGALSCGRCGHER